ncbi:PREDICTED: LOC110809924 isoform [Prunus dulcis]|uniref:PREDICTED: LOC110809924 isoform n=1 Tax=Prunus dulcis TaxID=3755 RepID=A0A5E4F371_PRUDU|nr:hypothetical protein L3X38_033967 [Prunus dulcis]VVA21081.1 PREDICTED: LOC110809924 isoform [Prunus dulcis]
MGDTASLDADNDLQLPLRNTHTSIRNTQIDNREEDDVPRNVKGIVNEAADDHEDDGSIRTIDWSDPETKKKAPKIRVVAEQKLNHLWKKHKANLKKNWYDPFLNSEERWNCTDDRVSKEQWRLLVQYWETSPAQKVNHRGVSPDRCKMFELCHLRKNGTPLNETAAKAMDYMNSNIIDIRDKEMQNQLPDEVTTEEINIVYAEVLGREKGNRVRGYGIRVRTEDMLGVLREKRGLRLEFDDMRESYEETIVQVTKDANEREERIKREMKEEGEPQRKR